MGDRPLIQRSSYFVNMYSYPIKTQLTYLRTKNINFFSGNRIYVLGGYQHDDKLGLSNFSVDYFHTKKKRWFHAFSLSPGAYQDLDCCVLSVPASTTKDFKPVKYPKQWILW